MTKTVIAPHLLPTDDLRSRLDKEVGGLSITLKNRGLDWLFYDLDGRTIVAHYYPAQSLLNIHSGGSARPTFQATGVDPDGIPDLLRRHLEPDEGDGPSPAGIGDWKAPVESELSGRQQELLFRVVVALAGNPAHAHDDPFKLVQRARDMVLHATHAKAQDAPEED